MGNSIVSIEKAVLCDVCLGIPLGRMLSPEALASDGSAEGGPDTFLFHGEQLGLLKSLYAAGRGEAVEAIHAMTEAADRVLSQPLYTVTDKPPERGADPHDYRSFAKYWWPNPDTEDGLPWVRRDGEVNPRCYGDESDYPRLVHFSETVVLLALAAYFSDEASYRDRAAAQLMAWFLDDSTRQNPHFRFAQLVPGLEEDRWPGLIEARHLLYVTEAVRVLEHLGALSPPESAALRDWYGRLLQWMRESAQGRRAEEADNNIALWYDLQCMVYAKFCGDERLVADTVRRSLLPRLARQIAPDGSLPREMSRARSYDYIAFSVTAMALLSRAAESAGIPLWDIEDGDGRNYQAAHDWLLDMTASERRLVAPVARILHRTGDGSADGDELQRVVDLSLIVRGLSRMSKERESLLQQADRKLSELSRAEAAIRMEYALANERLRMLEDRNDELRRQNEILKTEIHGLRHRTGKAIASIVRQQTRLLAYTSRIESGYRKVLCSHSWKMLGPVRETVRIARGIVRGGRVRRNMLPKKPALDMAMAEQLLSELTGKEGVPVDRGIGSAVKPEADWTLRARPSVYLRSEDDADPLQEGAEEKPEAVRSGADQTAKICRRLEGNRTRSDEMLRRQYQAGALSGVADTFVLYRIVGNDLYPRHRKGQSRENVRFILDNEPELPACEKRWIVNRIADPAEERLIVELLESRAQPYLRIPFDGEEYAAIGWDTSVLPRQDYLDSEAFNQLGPRETNRLIAALYRLKNNYVMNNNGARNAALRDGIARAKWVLPWDGNCFLTVSGWKAIREGIVSRPHLKYFVVPMQRITDNAVLLRDDLAPCPVEEPQIVFRCDAGEEFNESFCYGRRPKVELFWRLGIPGDWDRWRDDPWDQQRRCLSEEAFQYGAAGWVARMFSGVKSLEQESRSSFKHRGRVRQGAIISTIDRIDERLASRGSDRLGLTCYSMDALEVARRALRGGGDETLAEQARSIVRDAGEALSRGPYSVVHKSTVAPSGDPQDYWHPAPYWWPNPDTTDGLPYVKRDGERIPGTQLYEAESDKYDRTRLQYLFDDTVALALAWFLTGRREFAAHAARNVECWFVDPATCMNPHLRFAQVRPGHNGNQGFGSGIIEFKDLYYFLDAVRILESSQALSAESLEAFRGWLREYLAWLSDSAQGRKECAAANNHGTYYDLQTAAIAAFLGDGDRVRAILQRAASRIPSQFAADGSQPEELARSTTAHYCCFNLQGWLNLALLAWRYGFDLWAPRSQELGLAHGARWLMALAGKPWPYEQIQDFDSQRFDPLTVCASLWDEGGLDPETVSAMRRAAQARFDPHDGVPPYWNVAWPVRVRHSHPGMRVRQPAGGVIAFPHRGARDVVSPSGATLSMLLLAGRLRRMGVPTVVLVHRDGQSKEKWTGALRETVGPWKRLADEYGLPCYTVDSPVLGKGSAASQQQAAEVKESAWHWKTAIESLGVVAVHTNDASMHWTWGEICAALGLRQIWHERGLFRHRHAGGFLARANPVIAISDYVRSMAPNAIRTRVHVVRNPVEAPTDLDRTACRAALRREFGLPEDAVVFGMVANDNPRKRWDRFMATAVEVIARAEGRPVWFMAIGAGGAVVDELRAGMRLDPTVSARILCAGYRMPVYPIMYGLDCVVATAEREPLGRVLIEAAQLAIPVLATRSGGHTEVLGGCAPEFLVDVEKGPEELIVACMRFMSNPGDYSDVAVRMRDDMRNRYGVDAHASNILRIYREAGISVPASGAESGEAAVGASGNDGGEAVSNAAGVMTSAAGTALYIDPGDGQARKLRERNGHGQRIVRGIWDYLVASGYSRTFLDIGANYGEIGLGTRYPPGSHVHLFEANPRLEAYLEKSIAAHGDAASIRLHMHALGAEDGERLFGVSTRSSGVSSLIFDETAVERGQVTPVAVQCRRLDSCLGDLPPECRTAVLKLDVEGAELDVLKGAGSFLRGLESHAAIVELNPRAMTLARGSVAAYLDELSYYGELLELSAKEFRPFDAARFRERGVNKDIVVAKGEEALILLQAYAGHLSGRTPKEAAVAHAAKGEVLSTLQAQV